MKIVISQPMFLPWVGLFDQVRLADVFVHYDDVQLPKGRSFISRVQIPGSSGASWLTAPIDRGRSGDLISECYLVSDRAWRDKHLETIRHAYSRRKNFFAMFDLAREIYSYPGENLSEFNVFAIQSISDRIGLGPVFCKSSLLGVGGSSTERLVQISSLLGASTYITGHGALNYLNHVAFEDRGIEVRYMDYKTRPWIGSETAFSPYVTILDLLATEPFETVQSFLLSGTTPWRELARERNKGPKAISTDQRQ